MVEQRGLPFCAVVAVCAGRGRALQELLAVDILVAFFTFGRSRREVDVDQLGLQVRRLVTVAAGCGSMRPDQREGSFGVVKA